MSPETIFTVLSITPRALIEWALWSVTSMESSSLGDGHTVLLLPGNGIGERRMEHLRRFLTDSGFDARHWGLGTNRNRHFEGPEHDALLDEIEAVVAETGRKVSLVGWSLGGALARIAATDRPDLVRQVISVGTPFTGDYNTNNIYKIAALVKDLDADPKIAGLYEKMARPLPVPGVSIYSQCDGMVDPVNCIDPTGVTQSVEVQGTHVAMMINPQVFHAVAHHLAQPEGTVQ